MKKSLFIPICVAAFAIAAPPVSAQPRSPQPSRADRREVSRLMREALQLARRPEGRETAADRFLQAYERIPNCAFLANAAGLLRQVESRHADARRHAQRVMNGECQPSEDGTDRRIAQDILAALPPPSPTPVVTPPPEPVQPPTPPPAPLPEPVVVTPSPPTPPQEPPPVRSPILPPTLPVQYRESRPVPARAIGLWIAGGITLIGGALCLGWYIDAENNRVVAPNVDTGRWARASETALSVAIPTLITGAALAGIGFAFFALRPTRRVEVLPTVSVAYTGLQLGLRF